MRVVGGALLHPAVLCLTAPCLQVLLSGLLDDDVLDGSVRVPLLLRPVGVAQQLEPDVEREAGEEDPFECVDGRCRHAARGSREGGGRRNTCTRRTGGPAEPTTRERKST